MKIYIPTACLAILLPLFAVSQTCSADTALEGKMKVIGRDFKALKGQITDTTKKDLNLKLIAEIKASATAARDLEPEKTRDIPEAGRAKFLDDYKKALSDLIDTVDRLAQAVQDDKTADAQALLKDINEQKRDGHSMFAKDEDDKKGGHRPPPPNAAPADTQNTPPPPPPPAPDAQTPPAPPPASH